MTETVGARIVIEGDAKQVIAAFEELKRSTGNAARGMREANRRGEELDKSLKKLKDGLKAAGLAFGSVAVAAFTAKKAFDFASEGAQLQRLQSAASRMASSFGQDMEEVTAAIQDASNQAIPRFQAMQVASQALVLGVAKTPEEFDRLTTAAAALGQAMGRTTVDAMDDIVRGIGRMSPLILDNIGIMTNGGAIYEDYARKLGKTVAELTEAEKKHILLQAALKSAAPLLDANGNLVADNATAYEVLKAEVADLTAELKLLAADGLTPIVRMINEDISASRAHADSIDLRQQAYQRLLEQGIKPNVAAVSAYAAMLGEAENRASSFDQALLNAADSGAALNAQLQALPDTKMIGIRIATQMDAQSQEVMRLLGAGIISVGQNWATINLAAKEEQRRHRLDVAAAAEAGGGGGGGGVMQASGGPLQNPALVGEAGPELIIDGVVIPASTTRELMRLGLTPRKKMALGGTIEDQYIPPSGFNFDTSGGAARAESRAIRSSGSVVSGVSGGSTAAAMAQATEQAVQEQTAVILAAMPSAAAIQQAVVEPTRVQALAVVESNRQVTEKLDVMIALLQRAATDSGVGRAVRDQLAGLR